MTENSFHTQKPAVKPLTLAIAGLVVTGLVIAGFIAGRSSQATPPPPVVNSTGSPAPTPSVRPTDIATRAPFGGGGTRLPSNYGSPSTGVVQVVEVFLRGWTESDPARRKELLEKTATRQLTEQLLLTSPENIPREKVKKIDFRTEVGYTAELRAYFESGLETMIYAIYDPTAGTAAEWRIVGISKWG